MSVSKICVPNIYIYIVIGPLPVRISTFSLWIGKKAIENLTWFHQLHLRGHQPFPTSWWEAVPAQRPRAFCESAQHKASIQRPWFMGSATNRQFETVSTYQVSSLLSCMISPTQKNRMYFFLHPKALPARNSWHQCCSCHVEGLKQGISAASSQQSC